MVINAADGVNLLGNFSCSSDGDDNSLEMEKTVSPIIKTEPDVDLSQVFEKRIEGKRGSNRFSFRSLNEKHRHPLR